MGHSNPVQVQRRRGLPRKDTHEHSLPSRPSPAPHGACRRAFEAHPVTPPMALTSPVGVTRASSAASARGSWKATAVGILSTYPPTACGLATFSAALARSLSAHGVEVNVVRIADGSTSSDAKVVGELVNDSSASAGAVSDLLNGNDVAVIQHEYGLYGGDDGDEVIDVLGRVRVPSIVVAHTVLTNPTAHQRSVLVEIAAMTDRVVVMSDAARQRLQHGFGVDPRKVVTIAHGATVAKRLSARASDHPELLTWGLLGPGKGIERVIDAMATLHGRGVRPHYRVAGRTHPKVLAAEGESYRYGLIDRAQRLGIAASVSFDSTYLDVDSLVSLIQGSSIVVLPYDSTDQATSGVLVDAVASGRPVVATAFPHAVELLASGAGIVVDHDDPDALVSALHRLLTQPHLAAATAAEASRLAPSMAWPVVANAYLAVAQTLLAERRSSAS